MNNKEAIEVLKALYCTNTKLTKFEIDKLEPVSGEEVCQTALDENKAIRLAINSLETSIEFKPFSDALYIPKWEEYKVYSHDNYSFGRFEFIVCDNALYLICVLKYEGIELERAQFSFSQKGYDKVFEWIKTTRKELLQQLAGVE